MPLYVVGVDISKGEIDYLDLPRDVGRYVLENNTDLVLKGLSWYTTRMADTLNFAFTV